MSKSPRVLLYDIETAHNIAALFRLDEQYTNPKNILQERFIVSVAWKWLGEKRIYATSALDDPKRFAKNPYDDYHTVKTFHKVMHEADLLIAHNGDGFDRPWLNTRMLIHGLQPPPPIRSVDTCKVARQRFYFNSNKLDYLGKLLGIGGKRQHSEELWLRVLRGEAAAIREMVKYNKRDIILLEEVFLKLRPFIPAYINRELFGGTSEECPDCGSKHFQARGYTRTETRAYKRFQCQDCGRWFRSAKTERTKAAYKLL